jgi:hypothetical protein
LLAVKLTVLEVPGYRVPDTVALTVSAEAEPTVPLPVPDPVAVK